MAPIPDSLDGQATCSELLLAAGNNLESLDIAARLSSSSSSSSSCSSSSSSAASATESPSRKRWGSVKSWMFSQLLASSFARVSLSSSDNKPDECPSSTSTSATASASSSCSSSFVASKAASSGCNDWDVSYASLSSKPSNQDTTSSATTSKYSTGVRYEFDICRVIGSGSYGTVLLSRLRENPHRLFAIKMVPKCKLRADTEGRDTQRILTEKNVLAAVDHAFITKLYCAFETEQTVNFVMEYCAGGDMYFLLEKFNQNRLPESLVVFYAASIALALNYLHQLGIQYRDLKPENILIDHQGFIRLADFGFAREGLDFDSAKCQTFCGSADYIAPEVLGSKGYGLSADLWSFGCVIYELLTGFPPFYCPRDRSLLFRKIERAEPSFPKHFSPEVCDLLSKLLAKDPTQRLGHGPSGMKDVFAHPFFASIDWYQLSTKQVVPPYVPKLSGAADTSHFEAQFTTQRVEGSVVYEDREQPHDSDLFGDFDWCASGSAFA